MLPWTLANPSYDTPLRVSPHALWWTGPAFIGPEIWISRFQGTAFTLEDAESMVVRLVCHRIVDVLPKRADEELLEALAEIVKFYERQHDVPALPLSGVPKRRPITKITRSVRPDVTIPEEG